MSCSVPWQQGSSASSHGCIQGLNPKVRLVGDHRTGHLWTFALAKSLSGTCLRTAERAGKWLLSQSTKQFGTGVCQIPREFRQHLEETLLAAVGSSVPGCSEPRWQGQLSVPWDGFVLNKGVGMPPSAGIHHVCPEVLGESTAHFSHVFQNCVAWWLPSLRLMTDCMKTKSNSIFGLICFLSWSLHDLLEGTWIGEGKLSWKGGRKATGCTLSLFPLPVLKGNSLK